MDAIVFLILRITLAIALYAFLGWALWSLWQVLRQKGQVEAGALLPALTLTRQDEETPRAYHFTCSKIVIGRDPACECPIADQTVSARHAQLSFHHGQWWVEDLGSRNGALLNQQVIRQPLVVTSGDRLQCGQIIFDIQIGGADHTHNHV